MKTRIPRMFAILAGLSLLVVALLWLALPLFVSSDLVRSAIERDMSDFAGRQVELTGDLDLTLYPRPVARLTGITIPGDNGEPLLTIERLEADVALSSLLSRTPAFSTMKLLRPQLKLQATRNGLIEWSAPFGRIARAVSLRRTAGVSPVGENAAQATPPAFQLPGGFPATLARIMVEGGQVSFAEDYGVPPVTAINGTLDWPRMDGALSFAGEGVWRGAPVKADIKLGRALDLLAGGRSDVAISLSSELVNFAYDGQTSQTETLFADGTLSASTSSLTALLEWLEADFVPGRPIGAMSIEGPLKLANRRARFENANLSIAGSTGSGVLELGSAKDGNPLIGGTLDFGQLDLSRFLSAFIVLPEETSAADRPIAHALRSQLNTDLRISADEAVFGAIRLAQVAATAQVASDVAIFDIGDAVAYGGHVQARLQLATAPDGEKAEIFVSGDTIDLAAAAADLALPSSMPRGQAKITVTAKAPAASWSDIINSASGSVSVNMASGTIPGFGINALLAPESGDQYFLLTDANGAGEPFEALAFEGALNDGVIAIGKAELRYGSGTVSFSGVLPYRSGGIAVTAVTRPATDDAQAMRHFIGGSWDRAFATPLLSDPVHLE